MAADPYAILGLTREASAADIKKAHRKLVRASHPDLHPDDAGAEARFKAVTAAHDVLKDPATRARFDAGEIDAEGAERPDRRFYRDFAEAPRQAGSGGSGFQGFDDPAGLFAEILRQRSRGGASSPGDGFPHQGYGGPDGPDRGPDLRFSLDVPFLDAVRGARTRIGLPDGADLEIAIPRGLHDGQTLRLRGKGAPGARGGAAGDALVTIAVRPHPLLSREGDDILLVLPITIDEAILGAKVTAPTIDGPVALTVPKGASSGRVLRLRGRGVAPAGRAPGDQRVELRIVAPPVVDDALAAFMEDWRKTNAHDPRAELLKAMAP